MPPSKVKKKKKKKKKVQYKRTKNKAIVITRLL